MDFALLRERLVEATGSDKNVWLSLADMICKKLPVPGFPHTPRGQTLFSLADFSGGHSSALFNTYAFLALDMDRAQPWLHDQRRFRSDIFPGGRRLSFKALNDKSRQRALVPFLDMANDIDGSLIVFAVAKEMGTVFSARERGVDETELLKVWKPRVHEHLLRTVHLGALVIAIHSVPGQDLFWIADQDEIASNETQLRALTTLNARVWSNLLPHGLRHIRVGTTWSDDGSLALEDLTAIPDLVAGALCEAVTSMVRESCFPVRGLVNRLPTTLSRKTQLLMFWLASKGHRLRRTLLVIDSGGRPNGMRISSLDLPVIPNLVMRA